MELQQAVIYCRIDNCNDSIIQRMAIDSMFFRLAAYANSHKLSIVSYYEDNGYSVSDYTRPGLTSLLSDFTNMPFDTVLVARNSQILDNSPHKYPFAIQSIETAERKIAIS